MSQNVSLLLWQARDNIYMDAKWDKVIDSGLRRAVGGAAAGGQIWSTLGVASLFRHVGLCILSPEQCWQDESCGLNRWGFAASSKPYENVLCWHEYSPAFVKFEGKVCCIHLPEMLRKRLMSGVWAVSALLH